MFPSNPIASHASAVLPAQASDDVARHRREGAAILTGRVRQWVLKRGVLYGLTQTPMLALLVGFIFKWTTYPLAMTFTVLPTTFLLPAWILYRRRVSSDREEPANRFPRLLLWALFPIVVFDLARIPMHFALGNVFWGTWFDFGNSLTGQPPAHWSSLTAGTLLHITQGYVLALGYYVLFPRRSLLTALAYLFVGLSAFYSWLFPQYVILGPTPFKWYFVIWWAHFWFALAAWAVPRLDTVKLRARLRRPTIAWSAAGGAVLIAVATFSFVFWRVGTWEFPKQNTTDANGFAHLALAPTGHPVMVPATAPGEAEYRMTFRLGPRDYTNFEGAKENLGAKELKITGAIDRRGTPIAFCSDTVAALPPAAALATPTTFASLLRHDEYTQIPVTCSGPTTFLRSLGGASASRNVAVRWTASATLDADRDSTSKSFGGTRVTSLIAH
jgi:hypothetical protein